MSAENVETTTFRFIKRWRGTNPNRLTAELVSISKETKRRPDVYHFGIQNDLLIDPETGKPVLDFITPGVEYDIAEKLQTWAVNNDEGLAWWISPRNNKYPCEKIIIHTIAYTPDGKKAVLNSAILFDAELENPEKLRKTFFTAKDTEENLSKIIAWVEEVSGKKIGLTPPQIETRKQAEHLAKQIEIGVDPNSIIKEMGALNFLGNNPISCPPSGSFGFMVSHSFVTNLSELGKFVRRCGQCGAVINAFITKGYRCPHCGGVYEGC